MRILGIDPGLNNTGLGVIEYTNFSYKFIHNSFIKTDANDEIAKRLAKIYIQLSEMIQKYAPDEVALEQIFINTNPVSSMKLCFARSAVLCCCGVLKVPVFEYAPNTVKKSVVGSGHADKNQIQHMVKVLLCSCDICLKFDATDALAIAICHANHLNIKNIEKKMRCG